MKRWHHHLTAIVVVVAAGAIPGAWARDYADVELPSDAPEDYYVLDEAPQRRADGALARVQAAAEEMLAPERAHVWGRRGLLTPDDLTNTFAVFHDDGRVSGFNVLDAEGFADRYKCNLFVFELAFRAGLRIPLMGRLRGWGYPGPEELMRQIERGAFDQDWAAPADSLDYDALSEATSRGVPFILVGEGLEGRAGHMGFIDVVHRVEHDGIGRVLAVEYTGWEANGDGAHYRRRTWTVQRFTSIHLIELREPEETQPQCFAMGTPAAPSDLDAPRFARRRGSGRTPPTVTASP
jgi:hypothetical protein